MGFPNCLPGRIKFSAKGCKENLEIFILITFIEAEWETQKSDILIFLGKLQTMPQPSYPFPFPFCSSIVIFDFVVAKNWSSSIFIKFPG